MSTKILSSCMRAYTCGAPWGVRAGFVGLARCEPCAVVMRCAAVCGCVRDRGVRCIAVWVVTGWVADRMARDTAPP